MAHNTILCFENSADSHAIEESFKKCVVMEIDQENDKQKVELGLRKLALGFPWRVMDLADYRLLIEGPGWWKDKVVRAGVAKVAEVNLRVYPWDPSMENGFRLKSVWIRVVGFPRKHWTRADFAKLVHEFGVLLEIDTETLLRRSLREAKVIVGICNFDQVPHSKNVVFHNDRHEYCWNRVQFLLDRPIEKQQGGQKRCKICIRKDKGSDEVGPSEDRSKGVTGSGGDQTNGEADEDLLGDEDEEEWDEEHQEQWQMDNREVHSKSFPEIEQNVVTTSPEDKQIVENMERELQGNDLNKSMNSNEDMERVVQSFAGNIILNNEVAPVQLVNKFSVLSNLEPAAQKRTVQTEMRDSSAMTLHNGWCRYLLSLQRGWFDLQRE